MTRSRRLWLTFVGGPMAILVLAATAFLVVFWSSGDLEPIRQRARAEGIPATRAELGLSIRPDFVAAKARLECLATRAVASLDADMTQPQAIPKGPGTVIPPEWAAKVVNLPPELHDDVRAMLADLARHPLNVPLDRSPNIWPASTIQKLAYWRMTLMACGPAEDLPSTAMDLEDYLRVVPSLNTIEHSIRVSIMGRWLRMAQARLLDWPRPDPATAHRIRQWGDRLNEDFRQGCLGDVILIGENLNMDPFAQARDMGLALPRIFEFPGVLAAYHRLGRVGLLEKLVDQAVAIRRGDDPDHVLDHAKGCPCGHGNTISWDPVEGLSWFYQPLIQHRRYVWDEGQRIALKLRVMAAFLADDPLPADPFDPSDRQFKTQTKNGVAFAYYSVGPNGRDDGGKGDDIRCLGFAVEPPDPPITPMPLMPEGMPEGLPSFPTSP